MTKKFYYEQATEWLRDEAGRRGPSALMPTFTEVQDRIGAPGIGTVQSAYAQLANEGLVERLESPRRWAVVDRGQAPVAGPDVGAVLAEVEDTLTRALQQVRDLRLAV